MTTEEIYNSLELILNTYKSSLKETFEQESRNAKKLYYSVLSLLEDLEVDQPSDELFDDDYLYTSLSDEAKDSFSEIDKEDLIEETKSTKLSKEDLLGDDDEDW